MTAVALLNNVPFPFHSNNSDKKPDPVKATPNELFSSIQAESNLHQFSLLSAAKEAASFGFPSCSVEASCTYLMKIIKHQAFEPLARTILGDDATKSMMSRIDLVSKHLLIFQAFADEMENHKADLAANILKSCKQDNANICYLPGGWRGDTGQLVAIRAHFEYGSSVELRIVNRNHGAHVHKGVEKTSTMNDLASPGFLVDLQSDSGKQLFTEWSRLLYPYFNPPKDLKPCDLDFYGRLFCYAKENVEDDHTGRASKNRYFGGGTVAAIISMFADIFHTAGASVDEHRKFVLVIKLFALIQEFSTYIPSHQILFKEAIDRMLIRAAKMGPDECDTAIIEALCNDMKAKMDALHARELQALVTGTRMPCVGLNAAPKCTSRNDSSFDIHNSQAADSLFPFTPPATPIQLVEQLKAFKVSPQAKEQRGFIDLRAFLREVSCTSNKEFWVITDETALELLEVLKELVFSLPSTSGRQSRQLLAELSLISLDMAAVCAENISILRFESSYTLKLNVLAGHEAAFSDPDAVRTLERVRANFDRRAQGRIALFGAKIAMYNSVEVAYLLDHIITQPELERFLLGNPKETVHTVISKYLIDGSYYPNSLLPGKAFTKPFNNLLTLTNRFVATFQYSVHSGRSAYTSEGVLASIPQWVATFTAANRILESEFFQTRRGFPDDRQNLFYAIKNEHGHSDLDSEKVGVIYGSWKQKYGKAKEFNPEAHRELCTLEASRELRTLTTLDWIQRPHQFEHLKDAEVRDRLETLLFGPESALHAVRRFPKQLIESLVRFQTLYLESASVSDTAVLEWCSSVVDRFRYHLELEKSDLQGEALETGPILRALLAQHDQALSVQGKGALHRAIALSHLGVTIKNPEQFVCDLIRAAYHGIVLTTPSWPILLSLSRRLHARAEDFVKNEAMLSQLAKEIFQTSDTFSWIIDPKAAYRVIGHSQHDVYTFDLYTGASFNSRGSIIDLLDQLRQNKAFSHLAAGRSTFPVAVRERSKAVSVDGTIYFELEKENDVYCIRHPYKDFKLNFGDGKAISRCGMLEESFIDSREGYKPLCNHIDFVLQMLLGHSNVHTWRVERSMHHSDVSFERLLLDARDSTRAVFQNASSYVCMQQVDGVWIAQDDQFSFVLRTGQPDMDDLIARALPTVKGDSDRPLSGCGFLYEKGVATKMVIPALNISFSRCPDRHVWVYDQDINYKLMTQKSVPALDGYTHVIVLQHIREPKKQRLLVTPFAWKEASGQPVIDQLTLLQDRPFVCDVVGTDVVCDTAAHLYLAFIFRNMRKFDLALKHVERSRHLKVDGTLEQQMAMRIQRFPILTTAGLAFDIHFLVRALEHSERFSEKTFSKHEKADDIDKLLRTTIQRYQRSLSHYREEVSGVPEYLEVPQWMLDRYGDGMSHQSRQLTSGRLSSMERSTVHIFSWKLDKEEKYGLYKDLTNAVEKEKFNPARVSCVNPLQRLTGDELAADFLQLAQWAVGGSEFEKGKVRSYILCYLSQNEASRSYVSFLVPLLIIMLNQPEKFPDTGNCKDTVSCVEAALAALKSSEPFKEPCQLFGTFHKREPLKAPVSKPALLTTDWGYPWKIPTAEYSLWPTEDLYESNFTREIQKPYKKAQWPIAKWTSKNKLEMGLIESLNKAFERLQETERVNHIPNKKIILNLDERAADVDRNIASKEAEVVRLLNQTVDATLEQFRVLRAAEQLGTLTVGHALQALLIHSHRPLLSRNPTLTESDLDRVYTLTIEHQLLCIERKQIEEIHAIKNDTSRLGELLFRKRCYDPCAYPEILAYAAATGKDPSAQQARILEKLFHALGEAIDQKKVEHLLLEFAAGGGKTSLLIPILCMFLISRGKLPVICNTSDLYYQSLDTLPAILKAAFNLQLELIDRDVEHQWSEAELNTLKTKLERWHKNQGRAILMKESSWHSLNTAGKIACYQSVMNNDQIAERCRVLIVEILAYFKKHGVRLEDECQENSDPHEETIRSFEAGKPVPLEHHDIYYHAYQIANRFYSPGSTVTKEIAEAITEACIGFFMEYKPFKGLKWLEKYLRSDLNAPRPAELIKLDSDLADLCILAKACISLHLPHTEGLTLGKEYGDSIHPGDFTAAPRHDGRPSSAHFTDTMLVSALTIQKALEVGVPQDHLKAVVEGLRGEYDSALFKIKRLTLVEERIREMAGKPNFRMKDYTDNELEALLESKLRHPWLVDRYLTRHALVQNRFHGCSSKSTPAEMALGFNLSIQMSAFVGIPQIYSVLLNKRDDLLDTEFIAEVLAVLMERNLEGMIMEDRTSPKAFFTELFTKSPLDAAFLEAFFDRGLFANHTAQALLQGALDAAEGHNRSGITWDNERTIKIASSLLTSKPGATLAAFPLRQTTGRDYPELDFKARVAFLLGKKVTLSGVVQTAMRARKLLIPKAQTLFWCVMKDLWSTISPDDEQFDVQKVIRWALQNMGEELRSKILIRAYQGIDAELHAIAWELVHKDDWRSQSMLKVLCPEPKTRPWDLYAKEQTFLDTTDALQGYSTHVRKSLSLKKDELPEEARARIQELIEQTAALIDGIYTAGQESLDQTGFQNQEQDQKLNTKLQVRAMVDVGVDKKAAAETFGPQDSLVNLENFDRKFHQFAVPGIASKKLPEFFLPSKDRLTPRIDWKGVIKPLSHLLVLQTDDAQWKYYALTEAAVRFYVEDIEKVNPKAFVVGIGKSLHTTGSLRTETCKEQLNTVHFMQTTTLLNLMVGRTFDANALIATLKELAWTREDFRAFCSYIRSITPPDEDYAPEKYEHELFVGDLYANECAE